MKNVYMTLDLSLLSLSTAALSKHGDKIPGQYIVILKEQDSGFSDREIEATLRDAGIDEVKEKKQIKAKFKGTFNGYAGELKPGQLEKIKKDPRVKYVEQDEEVHLDPKDSAATPLSLSYGWASGSQPIPWGVNRVGGPGQVSGGKTAWIIDSGATPSHPDLNFDMGRSKSFISGKDVMDQYGHGTMVAGIIGARDNEMGVVGVAPNVPLVALRVFNEVGYGTLTQIYSALNHAFNNSSPGDVINMSLRVNASKMLDDLAIKTAAKGVFVTVAAGNSDIDCVNDSPARANAPGIYTVSAIDNYGKKASFSNFGPAVDFAAPGVNIPSTSKDGGYATGNGTSYAAPHVAGILLLHGKVEADGFMSGDKDSKQDPIAHR